MQSAKSSSSSSPTEEKVLLDSWKPEPLVPELDTSRGEYILKPFVITSKPGKYITIDGVDCLNLGTNDYLGIAEDPRLEEASLAALKKYGVGSCGPRAFYGTMDVHLKLEEELAKFLGVQETVLYSFGFSTIASAIPAYAKPGDVIFVDEQCNFAIQQGIIASKSRVFKFKHNDFKDLERLIEDLNNEIARSRGKKPRSFIILESIYAKTGDVCPLDEFIEVKKRHKIRLFIDESRSIGVMGSDGKGITQELGLDISDIDLVMASLENAFCAYGGFCAGSSYVIDHQRLAGVGYCFSASLPPLQTQVALESLRIISENSSIIHRSQRVFQDAHDLLKGLTKLTNISDPRSPIKHLVPKDSNEDGDDLKYLERISSRLLKEDKIAVSMGRYLDSDELTAPIPSIRLILTGGLVLRDIELVFEALEKCSLASVIS